ncbi:MAG TPA: poly-gamma-glutamate hydrolase family protein [Acidimicrobiales bacterium]|nr:poly-gamma-glutamate hydrolase family protein [Acidimicrobiales bacterium]
MTADPYEPAAGTQLAHLLAHPGVEEECVLRGRFGLMAIHGGNLERGTDVIAALAAERAGASLYTVRQPPGLVWHVPSTAFDPVASPHLAAFLAHVDSAVSVHGFRRGGLSTTLLVGGGNRHLAGRLATGLRSTMGGGFTVLDELEAIPSPLRGVHLRNPVNLPPGGGAQLELPPRVRRGTGAPTFREEHEAAVVEALVRVALGT